MHTQELPLEKQYWKIALVSTSIKICGLVQVLKFVSYLLLAV